MSFFLFVTSSFIKAVYQKKKSRKKTKTETDSQRMCILKKWGTLLGEGLGSFLESIKQPTWETGKVAATATALLEEYYLKSIGSTLLSMRILSRDEFCIDP